MSVSTSSKPARSSKRPRSRPERFGSWTVPLLTALLSAAAIAFFYANGSLYYFGDAESHLNIARRIIDSRTPGWEQFGTTWLPLPHALMLPFVRSLALWRNGLAGAIPSALCFIAAASLLYAAAHRAFRARAAAAASTAVLVLNPNVLYLQSTAMTEAVFFACLFGVMYATVAFHDTQRWRYIVYAGLWAAAGSLTRYEGWFLLPFVAVFFLVAASVRRWHAAALFGVVAALGPLLWIAYNWWVFDNPLEFYNGSSSAAAIQGGKPYPGFHDWHLALRYYSTAARLCLGTPLFWAGLIASFACLHRARLWPFILLSLPPLFYIWSMHSSGGSPIHVPPLPPHSWYNTRYGLALLPLAAFTCGALVALMPGSLRAMAAGILVLSCAGQWLLFPRPESWITWKEAQVNSQSRRAWTEQAVHFLAENRRPGESLFTSPGDFAGIYRRLGIPLRNLLTVDNGPLYLATVGRPDLFLWATWVVAFAGDAVQTAVDRASLHGPQYELAREIAVPGAPVVQIYLRPDRKHMAAR